MREDILAGIISGIISGLFLLFIERLVTSKSQSVVGTREPTDIIEPTKIIVKEKVVYKNTKNDSEDDSSFIFFVIILFMIVAVVNYIKYSSIVYFIIIFMSTAIGVMALGMAVFCIKKGMQFRKDLNIMLMFNMSALVTVPVLIWQTVVASEQRKIDMEALKAQITQTENFSIWDDMPTTIFLVYQIIGLMIIVIYMLSVLISNIYLISLINLNLNSGLRGMWQFLNQKTYTVGLKPAKIIWCEVIFLIISYLMVSGIILDLINTQIVK